MSENSQLDVDFINFAAGEDIDVKSPMNITQLCKEFKKKNGMSFMEYRHFYRIRDRMSEMEHINIETKVKAMFVLGSPVSNGLLIELKKEADVELDERHRIIEYNHHGKDLQLSGVHVVRGRSCDIKEEKKMLNFLAEKSGNATTPITDTTFVKEFNSSDGNLKCEENLKTRYNLIKQQIYLAPGFDQETKIKMMFVSSTKLHASILEELRKTAVVEVDENQRIRKYEANDGSLKLEGKRLFEEWSREEQEKLMNFIAEKAKNTTVPLSIRPLSIEFAEKNIVSRTMRAVEDYLNHRGLSKILKRDDFDIETRMRMMFALSAPVDEELLNKLREEAIVEVNEHQRITKYKSNDGNLELEAERFPPLTVWSKKENDKLLSFLAEKSKQTNVPLNIRSLSTEFAEKNGGSRTMGSVRGHIIKHIFPKISKLDNFDMETKIKILFALSISVDEEFLNELRKRAVVEVDEKQRITKYEANDESLKLQRDDCESAKMKTGKLQKKIISGSSELFEIDEKTEDDDEEEDVEEVSRPETRNGSLSRKRLPDNYFLSDSDDDTFEPSGNAKKSKNKREEKVTNKANSTSQTLKGKKRRITYFSETETEDYESEEEYKEEEFEANTSTRRSGRILKQQYSGNDFTCDDILFDSPENVNDSNKEKKTEKLVEKSSDPSSEAPLVKNPTSKNEENPCDATSSLSKFKKYERIAISRNDLGSDKIVSGTKKNDEEVEFDVIGEPHQEVKIENVEYKPDLSFLCNTTQNNMQICSGAEVNHTDDVNQSTENTEEMTNGKDFMKLLHDLVNTLDSPILEELQVKIEKAIEQIGDEDHKIPIDEIVMTLNAGLFILNKSVKIKPPTGESTNLRDVLLILQSTFFSHFHSSSFNTIQSKLKETIKKLDSQDKIIPVENIRPVLETLLLLVVP